VEALDILAFGAHPDDVELMAGGTISKLVQLGYRVGMVSLTAGETGTRGTVPLRRQEFADAAAIMGLVAHDMLDIPDGFVAPDREQKMKVIRALRTFRPQIVFTPYWKTRHPDHGNCSILVREASFLAGLKKIDTGQAQHRPAKIIYYCEHYMFQPSFIVDITETFEKKLEAIRAYTSQVFNADIVSADEDKTYTSSPEHFQSLTHRARFWGHRIGVTYGEPFLVRETLGVQDPAALFMAR
jgi:bacillithiol biosynthesis deacetylase BshB1